MRKFVMKFSTLLLLGLPLFFVACGDDDEIVDPPETPKNIVETAVATADLSTLVAALQQANLVSVLEGSGPFTVFAPTNAAFTAAGIDLNTISNEALTETLLYHVLGASIKSTDLTNLAQTYATTAATTGPGATQLSVMVERNDDVVTVNGGSNVTTANVEATNGIIHIVDKLLTPPTVVDHAVNNASFSSLVATLGAASGDLVNVLSGDGPFTVFAPTNAAFDAVSGVTATLDEDQLAKVLTYHVVAGNVRAEDITDGLVVTTVNGETFTVSTTGDVTITDANEDVTSGVSNVVLTNVQGTNGVVHVIDAVLVPMEL